MWLDVSFFRGHLSGMSDAQIFAFREAVRLVAETITDRRCGPAGAVAKIVGVSREGARQVLNRDGRCPPLWVVPLSEASGIPRSTLRPDLYPAADDVTLRGRPPRAACSPIALERAGQAVIPGTERKRRNG